MEVTTDYSGKIKDICCAYFEDGQKASVSGETGIRGSRVGNPDGEVARSDQRIRDEHL